MFVFLAAFRLLQKISLTLLEHGQMLQCLMKRENLAVEKRNVKTITGALVDFSLPLSSIEDIVKLDNLIGTSDAAKSDLV